MITEFDFNALDSAEAGQEIMAQISDNERDYLLQLLYRCTFNPDQEKWLSVQIKYCEDLDEWVKLKQLLFMNRIEEKDFIAMGCTYNMGDVSKAIRYMNMQPRKIELKKI